MSLEEKSSEARISELISGSLPYQRIVNSYPVTEWGTKATAGELINDRNVCEKAQITYDNYGLLIIQIGILEYLEQKRKSSR